MSTIDKITLAMYLGGFSAFIAFVIIEEGKIVSARLKKSNRKMLRERKFVVLSSNV